MTHPLFENQATESIKCLQFYTNTSEAHAVNFCALPDIPLQSPWSVAFGLGIDDLPPALRNYTQSNILGLVPFSSQIGIDLLLSETNVFDY